MKLLLWGTGQQAGFFVDSVIKQSYIIGFITSDAKRGGVKNGRNIWENLSMLHRKLWLSIMMR